MASKRNIKLRHRQTIAEKRRNNGELFAGGSSAIIGHTADLDGLNKIQCLFGMYESNPHYSTMEFDVSSGFDRPIVEPIFAYKDLIKLYLQSTIIRQCVESYKINIEGYGHTFEYIGKEGQQNSLAARNELARLTRLVDNLTTDGRPLQRHREDSRQDLEIIGGRAFEISQDLLGRTVVFNHVPAHTLRMTKLEKQGIAVNMLNASTGQTITRMRRFRRFVQYKDDGSKVWFKEFGDPRSIDPDTGKENNQLSIEDQATAIYYERLYTPGSPYGTPRWAGTIPSILGSREAEMVNLNFFRDNAIPALAVMVSGGALTEESFHKIEQYIAGVRGQKSMNRIVVLEASASGQETASIDGSLPAPKIDIKPMLSDRQHEGLFKDYIGSSDEKVRSSMRLPPVYIGSAKEYNRASAFASMLVADQQIFTPERDDWDTMFHHIVISGYNPKYWRYKSLGPVLSDPQEVSRIVTTLSREGGLTANVAIKLANRYLDADIEIVTEEWGDLPFAIIMQYIKAGKTVKGLDIFVEQIEDVGTNGLDDEDLDPEDETADTAAKRGIAMMMDELSETIRRDVATIEDAIRDNANQ